MMEFFLFTQTQMKKNENASVRQMFFFSYFKYKQKTLCRYLKRCNNASYTCYR